MLRVTRLLLTAPLFLLLHCSAENNAPTAQCQPEKIDAFKELLVVEPSVLADARASNTTNGPWSFRHMIENMTPPGVSASEFTSRWLRTWIDERTYNGQPLDRPNERRDNTMMATIVCPWLRETPANNCDTNCTVCSGQELDMAKAPFRLIAIANRIDLHFKPRLTTPAPVGEGRFVYALTYGPADVPTSQPAPMTVIFEYALPESHSLAEWAAEWHRLGSFETYDEPYRAALTAVTNQFTLRDTSPGRPVGNSLSQLRTNESVLNWIWQLREFELARGGDLKIRGTANTPFDEMNNTTALATWVKENSSTIKTSNFTVPAGFLGGSASQFLFAWTLPGVDEETRRAFAKETCSGCHTGDPPGQGHRDVAFHVSPFGEGKSRLSPFVYDPDRKFAPKDEVTFRTEHMQKILCDAKTGQTSAAKP